MFAAAYAPIGRNTVRKFAPRIQELESTGWDKNPPAPELPPDVVAKTREKYIAAYRQLTGQDPVL